MEQHVFWIPIEYLGRNWPYSSLLTLSEINTPSLSFLQQLNAAIFCKYNKFTMIAISINIFSSESYFVYLFAAL
jgi:hypothetical protein